MSKFIVLGDCHIGARNASPIVAEYQIRFFETELFPYMRKNKIKSILQLGDLFDSRKYTNHVILDMWKTRVFDLLEKEDIKFVTLLGNHDLFYKNTLKVNSSELFLSNYENITIISRPTTYNFYGVNFLIIPWICLENESEIDNIVKKSNSLFCAGHFEFEGFEMQKGVAAHGGYDHSIYKNFDLVLSGHYHTKNQKNNILYTGIPYELTWADFNDPKGFHIFDSKTHGLKFIETEGGLFNKLEYNDKDEEPVDVNGLTDTYVKVVVINKTDPYKFEKYINKILSQAPADLKITDIDVDFDDIDVEEEVELEDTVSLITKFIDLTETDLDKDRIKDLMKTLYIEALEITI